MSKVFIKQCMSYDDPQLKNIFEEILSDTASFKELKPGSKILLKPNLITKKEPEAAATTHPMFLRVLAQILIEKGFKVIVGDSPGGLFNKSSLKAVYDLCGLTEGLKDTGAELNYNTDVTTIENPDGIKLKELTITKYIQDVDYIINVPKLKTHLLMIYTGAIKNWFGIIAGEKKLDCHFNGTYKNDFANIIVDIYLSKKPHLTIFDAIVGMDHDGPTVGQPIDIKLVLAGEDGFALDLTALKIIGLDPMKVPVMKAAHDRNLLPYDISDIDICGAAIDDVKINNFVPPTSLKYPTKRMKNKFIELLKPKVSFNYKKCIRCRECGKVCPAKAISFEGGNPKVDQKKCIKCFCCHELCTSKAVHIKQSFLLIIFLILGTYNKRAQAFIERMFMFIGTKNREL